MPGRCAVALLLLAVALLPGAAPGRAWANSALVAADPAPGATLTTPPPTIRLTFSERPEPSLSEIRVLDSEGAEFQSGQAVTPDGDQLSVIAPLRPPDRGIYTVDWRVVSTVDGHASSGTFEFGIGVAPAGSAVTTTTTPTGSLLEVAARWIFLLGLVALLGASTACVAHFGGSTGSELRLAAGGWGASIVGLALLAETQRSTAGSSFAELLDTSTGRALAWRAAALAVAAAGLLVAWRAPAIRRATLALAAAAALAASAVHVGAGHAAAGPWSSTLTISAQVAHLAAAGIWFGGLAALLLGIRGEPSETETAAVRRFALFAVAALLVVVTTGTLRAIDELSSIGQLTSTGYGRAVVAKIALIALIAGLAARNRRRVSAGGEGLRSLRRGSSVELTLAVGALAVAALLGALVPPAPAEPAVAPGLTASGTYAGAGVQVELTTAATVPGPNRFTLRVTDDDSGDPVEAANVRLRFTPQDDPGVAPTSLTLRPAADGSYVGSGSNLAFDGRWAVSARIEQGSGVVEVPLQLDLPGPEYFVSVERIPEQPPKYTMQIGSVGYIRIEPDPERPGPSRVYVSCFTGFEAVSHVDELVLTTAAADGPTSSRPVRRLGVGRFAADVDLAAGPNTIVVVATTRDGTRLRGAFEIDVPGG